MSCILLRTACETGFWHPFVRTFLNRDGGLEVDCHGGAMLSLGIHVVSTKTAKGAILSTVVGIRDCLFKCNAGLRSGDENLACSTNISLELFAEILPRRYNEGVPRQRTAKRCMRKKNQPRSKGSYRRLETSNRAGIAKFKYSPQQPPPRVTSPENVLTPPSPHACATPHVCMHR